MKIIAYADAWSAQQGDTVAFKVSCEMATYRADIVRLFQADDTPEGPGFREAVISAHCAGAYPGRVQKMRPGSCLIAPDHSELRVRGGITIACWIFATMPGEGVQGIVSKGVYPDGPGYHLFVDGSGELAFSIGEGSDATTIHSGQALEARRWYFVAATYDGETGSVTLTSEMAPGLTPHWTRKGGTCETKGPVHGNVSLDNDLPLLIAATNVRDASTSVAVNHHFNGKIGEPCIYSRSLSKDELDDIRRTGESPSEGLVASWDFAATPFTSYVPDRSCNNLDAQVINAPMRATTGHNWDATVYNFRENPEQYQAIYFHNDDVDDAGWETDFAWEIPHDLASGVYAARLRSGEEEEYVPVFVRPAAGAETAEILFLVPTFTYQAYANERFHTNYFVEWTLATDRPLELSRQDRFLAEEGSMLGCSTYDAHADRSYCCYSSRLRPVVNLRPRIKAYWNGAGRHFGADMYLVDWLDRKGFAHDIATDEDLDAAGIALLEPYRVVVLGSHPEYFSRTMRDALEEFVGRGGRLMNLGGNGCWWVTSRDPVRPHVVEIRKEDPWGISGMGVGPGEAYHSTTGEMGGAWPTVGKAPGMLFGSGYTSQGFAGAQGYHRQPDSFDPGVAFIFEGVGEDEVIGDFGLAYGGAAGDEFDCVGGASPPDTLQLASSSNHDKYCLNFSMPYAPKAEQDASVRSDLSYYETLGGGAVFASGSMCWCTSLPHNDYDNNVSRITENVLRKFVTAAGE